MDRIGYIIWLVFVTGFCAFGQPGKKTPLIEDLETHLPRWMDTYRVPGAQVIIIESGEMIYQGSFGLADHKSMDSLTSHHRFPLSVFAQPLTAYAVLKLAAEDRIKLDLPVNTYLKRWEISEGPFNPGDVTVRGLLSHTAGINTWDRVPPSTESLDPVEMLEGGGPYKPAYMQYRPGSSFHFSRAGYTILQLLIEDVTGRPYAEFLQEAVFAPLGMSSAGFSPSEIPADLRVQPHNRKGRVLPFSGYQPEAASGLIAAPADYGRFLQHLMRSSDRTGQPTSLFLQMRKPQTWLRGASSNTAEAFGLGFYLENQTDSTQLLMHGGPVSPGWNSRFYMMPDRQAALIVCTNGANGKAVVNRVISTWAQSEGMLPPKLVRTYLWLDLLIYVILGVVLLLSLFLVLYLYRQRGTRRFGFLHVRRQAALLTGWLVITIIFTYLALPMVEQWVPYTYNLIAFTFLLYLGILLGWVLFPEDHRQVG